MSPSPKSKSSDKPLTPVMEDYLEAIFDLDKEKRAVRVKDIAKRMDVKMPTVSSMLKTLNERGMVNYEKYEYVELTKDGAKVGKEIRRRHGLLHKFLVDILKIDLETANEDACKMEHALSDATLASLTDFMDFIQSCPRAGESWLEYFEAYRRNGNDPEKCRSHAGQFVEDFNERISTGKKQAKAKQKK